MPPTYEHSCINGHEFETVQSIKDDPIEKCPICGEKAKRLISQTGFILKGEGWAKTGYTKEKK